MKTQTRKVTEIHHLHSTARLPMASCPKFHFHMLWNRSSYISPTSHQALLRSTILDRVNTCHVHPHRIPTLFSGLLPTSESLTSSETIDPPPHNLGADLELPSHDLSPSSPDPRLPNT